MDTIFETGDPKQSGPMINWRHDIPADNYYSLRLTGDGYLMLEAAHGSNDQTLYPFTYTPAINQGNKKNIAISFNGDTSTIHVNGMQVTSLRDSFSNAGVICLVAFTSETRTIQVAFDDLVVYSLDGWTPSIENYLRSPTW